MTIQPLHIPRPGYLPQKRKHIARTDSSFVKVLRQVKNGRPFTYAQLCWDRGKRTKSLGPMPSTPTALLDVAVAAAWRDDLTDEELLQLLRAPKNMRDSLI